MDFDKLAQQKKVLEDRLVGSGKSFNRIEFWVPKRGPNRIRIMPCWTDDPASPFYGTAWREVHQHWHVSDTQKAPILCTKGTPGLGTPCAVCDYVDALRTADKTDLEAVELAKKIKAKASYLMGVVDLKNPIYTKDDVLAFAEKAREGDECPFAAGDTKIQVYAAGLTVFNAILGFIMENGKDVTDREHGHDVTITKTGEGIQNTKYEVTFMLKETKAPLKDNTKMVNLEEVGFVLESTKVTELLMSGAGQMYPQLVGGRKALSATSKVSKKMTKEEEMLAAAKSADDDDADDLEAQLKAAVR